MKEISFGAEARTKIKNGIDKAADAVAPTLGAVGMSALIDWEGLDPIVSDDGVTILKNLEFEDKYENMGLKMLRKAAIRTSNEGGDGTATTTVLTRALVAQAFREIASDSSKIQDVRERLIKGRDQVIELLSEYKKDISNDEIVQIAKISSLDDEVSELIATAIKEVGKSGVISVEKSAKIGYDMETVKGMKFESGYLSPHFITDKERELSVLESPAIVIVDRKVSMNEQIVGIMNSIAESGHRSVLWVADDVDSLALASLIVNQQAGNFKVCCVKNPYTASRAQDFLHDLAALTGGTVISEGAGLKLPDAKSEHVGFAEKVVVSKTACTIIGGKGSPQLSERITALENKISETTSEYEKAMLEERLAALTTGVGVIRVGTYTDVDFMAKKLKFENAINATQAALAEGILPGGGVALYQVSRTIEDDIFKNALIAPIYQMIDNASVKDIVAGTVIDAENGFDFRTKKFVNMFEAGIIDPFKVTRLAIESAVSVTLNLITTETAIVTEVKKEAGPQLPGQ